MTMKTKLASDKVAEVLSQVGPALRALSEENTNLKEKVAYYEKRDRVEKLAARMDEKNLDPETSYNEKIERLMGRDDLEVVEEAVNLSAPQIKLAALSDHPGNASSAGEAALMTAILGD